MHRFLRLASIPILAAALLVPITAHAGGGPSGQLADVTITTAHNTELIASNLVMLSVKIKCPSTATVTSNNVVVSQGSGNDKNAYSIASGSIGQITCDGNSRQYDVLLPLVWGNGLATGPASTFVGLFGSDQNGLGSAFGGQPTDIRS